MTNRVITNSDRIPTALFFLRISVFLVMFMWTIDKFINPAHSVKVYEGFYFISLGQNAFFIIGAIEMVILTVFLIGYQKKYSYGAVLILHAMSTLSSYAQYFSPYDGPNLLFFAAWPMLAACFALYSLRDLDTRYVIGE